MSAKKVVLAYSGGLDTSCILADLIDQGWDVVAFVANVGQKEDFEVVAERARTAGAVAVHVLDLREEFVTDYVFPAIAGHAIYESRYLLGTALARPVIAKHQVAVAEQEGASAVAHGATGKGNDQVRFELAYAALAPRLQVIAPWKDPAFLARFKGRTDLLRYAAERNLPVEASAAKPYSTDENLMHKSYEAGVLEDPLQAPDPSMFTVTRSLRDAPDEPDQIEIHFKDAIPVKVVHPAKQLTIAAPLDLFLYLNGLGALHGIGRIDIVENRYVGIKSRGVYETPGGTILHHALRDLEGMAMDREVQRLRNTMSPKFAELIYNGFWFSPEMDFLRGAFAKAQEIVDGRVLVELYKGNCVIQGRESPSSLYDRELSSMDVEGGYDQKDAAGFIRINALRLKAHRAILAKVKG